MGDDTKFRLIVAFPDVSDPFCFGFEAGTIWQRMQAGDVAEIDVTTRVENREVIRRMAVADGWAVEVAETGTEGWDQTNLSKTSTAPVKANPRGFHIIDGGRDA